MTNDRRGAASVITRYAQRMLIENALSDAVRFFHLDALSSAVGLKVDFDMALLVIASGLYRLLARTMRGYADAQARQIFRDLIDMPATVEITQAGVVVEFHRRAHLPIVMASGLLNTSQQVGGALGLAVLSTLAASKTSSAGGSPTHALVVGFHWAFAAGAVVMIAALAAMLALLRSRTSPASSSKQVPRRPCSSEPHERLAI